MPLVSSINLNSTNGIQTTAFALSRDPIPDYILPIDLFLGGFIDDFSLVQHLERFEVVENLSLFEKPVNDIDLFQKLPVTAVNLDLNDFDGTEVSELIFNQVVGDIIPINNPTKLIQIPFLLEENFQSIILNQNLRQESIYTQYETWIGQSYSGIQILTLNLDQFDADGPDIINLIPASGSVFNNPQTNVSFDIFDSEGSAVVSGSLWLYANNLLLISGGVIVCPPASGVVTYTQITTSLFQVEWNPSFSFNPELNPVVISGVVQDDETVPNVTNFNYSFNVWYSSDLSVSISGTPDVMSPYLKDLNPGALQTQVPVSNNINLSITDDHTGLKPDSVSIYVDSIPVVLSGTPINLTYASTTINSIDSGNGREYIINPVSNFSFSDEITVDVEAVDNYSISPNMLNTSYSFYTQTNTHIGVSGLKVNVSGNYLDLNISDSLPIVTTGTEFKVTYYNLLNLGINTSGSYVSCNGLTVTGTSFVSVSGTDVYDVFFTVIPDFTTDCDLIFHVEQLTLISGNVVFSEASTEILWGAQFCYDPETNLSYSTDIPVIAQAEDFGFLPSLGTMSYKFSTVPSPGNSLYAQIVGIEDLSSVSGYYASHNPFFEYGKTMELELEAKDFAGNTLVYTWTFKIEENGG